MTRPVEPQDLYTLTSTPHLIDPVLIVQLDGWIDASGAASAAMAHMLDVTDPSVVARFDAEWLIDHRARRPVLHIVDGVNSGLDWPVIEMVAGRDRQGADVLLLHGAEPDHHWRLFVESIVGLCHRFGVTRMIGLGAYPAAVPHTRATPLSVTASTSDLAVGPYSNATIDVPAGIESAIEEAMADINLPAIGLWAQVPHYVAASPFPAASASLLDGLRTAASLDIELGDLTEQGLTVRNHLDSLVANDSNHQAMLADLERRHDELVVDTANIPDATELAAEVEQYLRDHGNLENDDNLSNDDSNDDSNGDGDNDKGNDS